MRDLTVDICVLIAASGPHTHYGTQKTDSLQLLTAMEREDGWSLAYDPRIASQYTASLGHGQFGHHWLAHMLAAKKAFRVPPLARHRKRQVHATLRCAKLNDEDGKYVEVASQTRCNRLVTHDKHSFTSSACQVLRAIPVYVVSCANACRLPEDL